MERPTDLMARCQVWINYKHNSTIKFLIGITPKEQFLLHQNVLEGESPINSRLTIIIRSLVISIYVRDIVLG